MLATNKYTFQSSGNLGKTALIRLLVLILLISTNEEVCTAQKESNKWYFGLRVGLDFNSDPPKPLFDGQMIALEGCSSYADSSGKLLFYTNGEQVWNRQHEVMPNGSGLHGHSSSTQSSLIVPLPDSQNKFLVFTTDWKASANGFKYSEVNMSLAGGLGDVSKKNIQVLTPVLEKLTAVHHANKRDIWIVVHGWHDSTFYSYLVTPSGIDPVPVLSKTGPVLDGKLDHVGSIKISPDGKWLAMASWSYKHGSYLFGFDNTTGKVSSPQVLMAKTPGYGVEFSSLSKYLYVSDYTTIYQYDLSAQNIPLTNLKIGEIKTGTSPSSYLGSMQLAPDGKIYLAYFNKNYLARIKYPDLNGASCVFEDEGLKLSENTSIISYLGLPTTVQSHLKKECIRFTGTCAGQPTLFSSAYLPMDSLKWHIKSKNGQTLATFQSFEPSYTFTDPGTYLIELIAYEKGLPDTIQSSIEIFGLPRLTFFSDTLLCDGNEALLQISDTFDSYLWQDGSKESSYTTRDTDTSVWVMVGKNKCYTRSDSLRIRRLYSPKLLWAEDTVLCLESEFQLSAYNAQAQYLWHDGYTRAERPISEPGKYSIEVSNTCGNISDSIQISFKDCSCFFFAPNAFSPNGNNINDLFRPSISCPIEDYSLYIFNSYGEQIFQTNNYSKFWRGTYRHKPVAPGVYLWVVYYNDHSKNSFFSSGTVTLLK